MLQEIIERTARVGALHAVRAREPASGGPAAARLSDPIRHKSFLGALLGAAVGALIGAAVFAAAAAVIAGTGGLATVAVLAAGTAGTLALGGVISRASNAAASLVDSIGPPDGTIISGSPDVYIEGLAAARAVVDTVVCSKHPPPPPKIAQGSESVFINGQPAARVGDKTTCGAPIKQGASGVYFGSGQRSELPVADEFSFWEKALLVAVEFLVPPSRGMLKGAGRLFTKKGGAGALKGALMGARQAVKTLGSLPGKLYKGTTNALKKLGDGQTYRKALEKVCEKDPIDVTTGELVDQRCDISLGQTLPLHFIRTWAPGSGQHFALGVGWTDSFHQYATLNSAEDVLTVTTVEGQALHFILPPGYDSSVNPEQPNYRAARLAQGFALTHRDSRISQHFTLLTEQAGEKRYLLTREEDNNGNHLVFHHDAVGRLQRVSHSDGIELALHWQPSGYLSHIDRVDNGLHDCLARYQQNAAGQLIEADSQQHYHLYYDYNAQGLMHRWHDNDQTWAEYRYDAEGRCTGSTCAGGYYPGSLTYLPGVTLVSDSQGRITRYEYNAQGNVTAIETPDGHRTRRVYDRFGQLCQQTWPSGRTERLEYLGDSGLVSAFYDASGACWRYTYDDQHRLMAMADPLNRVWWQTYDDQGNPASFIAPDESRVELSRNAFGLVTTVRDSDGNQQRAEYDEHQRLISLLDEEQRRVQLRYTSRDELRSLAQSGGALWHYRYDAHRRITAHDRPNNSLEHYRHDRHGNLTAYRDANGIEWQLEYGPFDLPVARIDGEGQRWHYRYDPDHLQLIEVTNPQGEHYRYQRDAQGRVTEEQDYAGTVWHYAYDEDGRCIEKRDAVGNITRNQHDGAGRLVRQRTPEGQTEYHYDALGRLLCVEDAHNRLEFAYDLQGRLIRESQNGRILRRSYPDSQTQTRFIDPEESESEQPPLSATFRRNRVGEWVEVTLGEQAENNTLYASRDVAGHDIERRTAGGFLQRNAYDLMGNLTHQRAGCQPRIFSGQTLADIPWPIFAGVDCHYRYDGALNLTELQTRSEHLRYAVNGNRQVTHVANHGQFQEAYAYDRCGYLTQQRVSSLLHSAAVSNDDIYQPGHQLRGEAANGYFYDEAGRMSSRWLHKKGYQPEQIDFTWNSRNQLTRMKKSSGEVWHYRYDPFGRRTEKACPEREERTTYLWDGDTIAEIREYKRGTLQRIRHWVFEGWELLAQQTWRPTAKARAAFTDGPVNPAGEQPKRVYTTHYAVCAPTGQPLALFNSEGKVQWQKGPTSLWGVALGPNDAPHHDPGLGFAGQQWDEESGLFYNRHRFYLPEAACYLSPDPLGLAGGENTYSYVSNPLSAMDPLGLVPCGVGKLRSGLFQGVKHASAYLKEQGVPRQYKKQILESFERGTIKVRAASANEYGLRYYDRVNANAKGRYLFETFPASRESLAIKPEWNQMTNIAQFRVRSGSTIIEGRASAQGPGLPGGQMQKYINNLEDLTRHYE